MNKKIIIKLSLLIISLVVFYYFKTSLEQISQSNPPQDPPAVTPVFEDLKSFQWCSEVQGQFMFKRGNHLLQFSNLSDADIKKQFCTVDMESFAGVDVKKIKSWEVLATAVDSGGGEVILEWNAEHRLFKADDLPFRSKKLRQKLSL